MSNPEDIRRGRPSCSHLDRLEGCPPSHRLSIGHPNESGADAISGNRIHAWLETQSPEDWAAMAWQEQETAEACDRQAIEIIDSMFSMDTADMILREERLGLTRLGVVRQVRPGDGKEYLITGQGDLIVIRGIEAVIIDYKTGRGDYESASENRQLRGLAAHLWVWRPTLERIRCGLVQPWNGPQTVADFDYEALQAAAKWLEYTVYRGDTDSLENRVAGKWCHFCPFGKSGNCSTFNDHAQEPVEALTARPLPDDPKPALFARAMELDAASLGAILDKRQLNGWFWNAVEGAAQRRIEAGESIPGWSLRATKPREKISDVGKVWDALAPLGCGAGEFAAACTMTKKALEPLVRKLTGEKGNGLKAAVGNVLAGAVTFGAPSVSLVKAGAVAGELEGDEAP